MKLFKYLNAAPIANMCSFCSINSQRLKRNTSRALLERNDQSDPLSFFYAMPHALPTSIVATNG